MGPGPGPWPWPIRPGSGPGPWAQARWLAGWPVEKKTNLYFEDLKPFFAHQIGNSQEMFDLVQVLLTLYENGNSRGVSILVQGESSGTPFLLKVSRVLTTYRCTR